MDFSELNPIKLMDLPLPEQIAERINSIIIEQHLHAGDKIPTEFELMEKLNVGRSTIREALKILVARNVLEIRRGRGTFIAENPGLNTDPLGFAYIQDKLKLAKELFEVRERIEPWTAFLAAQRATQDECIELRNLCDKVIDMSLDPHDHGVVDKAFHAYIAHCTHNQVICNLAPIITYSVQVFSSISESKLRLKTNISHKQICDAICAHDGEAAKAAVLSHLEANRNCWEKLEMDGSL